MADLAIKLVVLGGGLALAPLFMGNSLLGKALVPVSGFGWLLLAIGLLIFWLNRKKTTAEVVPFQQPTASRPGAFAYRDVAPIDLPRDTPEAEAYARTLHDRQANDTVARSRPQTWSSEVFDVIEWRRFEALVEALFAQSGFITKSQSHGVDEGIDIWLYPRSQPDKPFSLIQCKHWSGKRVGVDKVRELRGVMAAKNVKNGLFATTSSFTPEAQAFAAESGINLIDMDGLLKIIGLRPANQQQALLAVALEGEYWRPTCVNCGVKMTERTPRSGGAKFWGCVNYPRCKTTMALRA